jgi:hypothetical protein
MAAVRDRWMNNNHNETLASQEMEAHQEERKPTSLVRKPEAAEQREVPVEDAVVKPVDGRKKRHRGKNQAAGRRGEPKKLIRGDCGSWMQLAAACSKVSCRATVAWRKRDIFKQNTTRRAIVARPRKNICRPNMTRCAKVTAQETQFSKQSRRTTSRTGTAEESDKTPFYKRNPEGMDSQMETTDAPGRHQGNQESRYRGPATAWKQVGIQQDPQERKWTGNSKEN